MNRNTTIFLKAVIILIGVAVLAAMIRFPLTEGRAVNLDLLSIYTDSFIIYGYLASIPFFVGLYQVYKLLGHSSVHTVQTIKYCAIIQSVLIMMPVVYIGTTVTDDDPAGFISMGIMTTLIAIGVAIVASVFKKRLQKK